MKYCTKCGRELMDEAIVCPGCGCSQDNAAANNQQQSANAFIWGLLGFFVPMAGLVLYILWRESEPAKANAAGIGALIGFIGSTIFGAIIGAIGGVIESLYMFY